MPWALGSIICTIPEADTVPHLFDAVSGASDAIRIESHKGE